MKTKTGTDLSLGGLSGSTRFGVIAFALLALVTTAQSLAADLKVINTKHYTLHTDVEPALAKDLATRLDAMYDEYDRRLADFQTTADDSKSFEVYVFNERVDYMKFTGNRLANTGGVFMPDKNQLVAFLEGQGRDGLRRTLQHEAFHQFAYRSISRDLPPWLNEGLAQLFEEGVWTGRSFLLNQVPPRRTRQLEQDIKAKRLIAFDKFLPITLDQWNQTLNADAERGAAQYNQAWAMVYFLVNAGTENGGKAKYRDRLLTMLRKTNTGMAGDQAFAEAFSDNIKGFQDRFVEYVRSLKPTQAATMLERQNVLADLLKGLTEDGQRFADVNAFKAKALGGGYQLSYSMGNIRWQTDPNVMVYFSGMDGKPFDRNQLFFDPRSGAPLPDLVCRPGGKTQIRTRFYRSGKSIEHEVLVETVR
ncbi:MAG TPA: DUF1570 domain-containing protein [Tepidisphaeraceae bacterium]|nr:DUF1570 domain-containing protein [Tepidisphaeraceae bacterium]